MNEITASSVTNKESVNSSVSVDKASAPKSTEEKTNGILKHVNESDIVNQGVTMFNGTKRIRNDTKNNDSVMPNKEESKSKKLKRDSSSIVKCNDEDTSKDISVSSLSSKFKWEEEIRAILSKNTENGLKIKTVKKKLLKRLVKYYCKRLRNKCIKHCVGISGNDNVFLYFRYVAGINNTNKDQEKLDTKVSKKLSKLQNKFQISPDGKRLSIKAM